MWRAVCALVAVLLAFALAAPARAGINVFVGSPTIPNIVNANVTAVPARVTGAIPGPVASGSGTANLWVDGAGTCARQASAGAWVDAAGCATFDAACDAAFAGDVVKVKAGSYGAQTITCTARTTGAPVTIQPADGETVTLTGKVDITARLLKWAGPMTSTPVAAGSCDIQNSTDVTLEGLTFDSGGQGVLTCYFGGGNTNITLRRMDMCCNKDFQMVMFDTPNGENTNTVIEDSVFHDQAQSTPGQHMECLYINGNKGITVRRNRFYRCRGTGSMFITMSGSTTTKPTDVLVEQNVIENGLNAGDSGDLSSGSVQENPGICGAGLGPIVFRYNFIGPSAWDCSGAAHTWTGNILTGTCQASGTYRYNVQTGQSCGTGDSVSATAQSSSNFVNLAGHNLRPASGAFQVDKADATDYPATDLDGTSRYLGSGPDAGPYEGS
jgi:hypothetical protein